MGKKAETARTALSFLHTFLMMENFYMLAAAFFSPDGSQAASYFVRSLLVWIPILASYACIRKVGNLWCYLAAGAVCYVVMKFLSGSYLTAVLTAALFLGRGYVRIRRGRIRKAIQDMPGEWDQKVPELWEIPTLFDCPRMAHWVLFLFCYIALLVSGCHRYLRIIYWMLFAEVLVWFIYRYLENLTDFVRKNQRIANLPVRTMQHVARNLFILLAAGLLLFLLPSVLYNKEPLTEVRLPEFAYKIEETPQAEAAPQGPSMEEMLAQLGGGESFEPPQWLMTLMDVLVWVVLAAGLFLLLRLLWRALKKASNEFAVEGEDEILSLDQDEEESIEKEPRGLRGMRERLFSENQRIRRRYRRLVKKGAKERLLGTETPEELEKKAGMSGPEHEELHKLYEKARYSKEGV